MQLFTCANQRDNIAELKCKGLPFIPENFQECFVIDLPFLSQNCCLDQNLKRKWQKCHPHTRGNIIEDFLFAKSDKRKKSKPKNQIWYISPVVRLLRMVQDIRCSSYGSPSLEVHSLLLSTQSREGACNTLDLSLINNLLGNSGSNLH